MKITDLNGLYVAYNTEEDFRILVVAQDEAEAMDVARSYFSDSNMYSLPDGIEISEFDDVETKFDCDYVVTFADGE